MVHAGRSSRPRGGRTANVVATLKGTENPELIYVVSSHFDSVAVGPGADDDTSGTAALLEAARILQRHAAAGDDRLRVVHGRGSRPARQPRVRAARRREQVEHRRRAEQRHDRLGRRKRADGQHDSLLERRHPRHPARRGVPVHEPRSCTTRSTTRAPTRRRSTTAGATSSAASARIRCWRIRTITSRRISSRR